ncbi:MAG: alpha/beta fold hydrolase [Acutalibacteraceae bacterium]|nr:alpha/beta fold hydrolase [Acutalibacteraceae bacterium]
MHSEYIRDVPNGDTVVLFIHGILGSPRHFDCFVSALPPSYAVYNILLDGHGKTIKDFSHTSMNKWKNQVQDTVEQLVQRYKNIVIVAHSMGTLFAMDMAVKFSQVKLLFLLNSPLKVFIKPNATINSIKVVMGLDKSDDLTTQALKNACSITLNKKLWCCVGWIPRYLELLKEIRSTRNIVEKVKIPCYVFHSKDDELVSAKSIKFLKKNKDFNITVLENSTHFSYSERDTKYIVDKLNELIITLE